MERTWHANHRFSPAELRVAKLLLKGLSSKEMARVLKRSPRTVEIHRQHILAKIGAKSTVEAVLILDRELRGDAPFAGRQSSLGEIAERAFTVAFSGGGGTRKAFERAAQAIAQHVTAEHLAGRPAHPPLQAAE